MPELPEVEMLVRHLQPLIRGKTIERVEVRRERIVRPTSVRQFKQVLHGARFGDLTRRGKYLLFQLMPRRPDVTPTVVGHLGMTGRMYLLPACAPLPIHAAVVLQLGGEQFVFEDTRYFGRFTLDNSPLARLGPEPLESEMAPESFGRMLKRSRQAIKVKLLDQAVIAGVGNIYASEALFLAGIPPRLAARRLSQSQVERLWKSIREVLAAAIDTGSTLSLDFAGQGERDGLFYYGDGSGRAEQEAEQFRVYDRAGQPCRVCGRLIKRAVQANRSTFFCPGCQRRR